MNLITAALNVIVAILLLVAAIVVSAGFSKWCAELVNAYHDADGGQYT